MQQLQRTSHKNKANFSSGATPKLCPVLHEGKCQLVVQPLLFRRRRRLLLRPAALRLRPEVQEERVHDEGNLWGQGARLRWVSAPTG